MGRYYEGDIEGKFMLGVQPSEAPKFFGAEAKWFSDLAPANYLHYLIRYEDYEKVKQALDSIDSQAVQRVVKMFDENEGWNDETAEKYGVSKQDLLLYSNKKLGDKIIKFFDDEERDCNIYAELF